MPDQNPGISESRQQSLWKDLSALDLNVYHTVCHPHKQERCSDSHRQCMKVLNLNFFYFFFSTFFTHFSWRLKLSQCCSAPIRDIINHNVAYTALCLVLFAAKVWTLSDNMQEKSWPGTFSGQQPEPWQQQAGTAKMLNISGEYDTSMDGIGW